jgi:hypothetical protein
MFSSMLFILQLTITYTQSMKSVIFALAINLLLCAVDAWPWRRELIQLSSLFRSRESLGRLRLVSEIEGLLKPC